MFLINKRTQGFWFSVFTWLTHERIQSHRQLVLFSIIIKSFFYITPKCLSGIFLRKKHVIPAKCVCVWPSTWVNFLVFTSFYQFFCKKMLKKHNLTRQQPNAGQHRQHSIFSCCRKSPLFDASLLVSCDKFNFQLF